VDAAQGVADRAAVTILMTRARIHDARNGLVIYDWAPTAMTTTTIYPLIPLCYLSLLSHDMKYRCEHSSDIYKYDSLHLHWSWLTTH